MLALYRAGRQADALAVVPATTAHPERRPRHRPQSTAAGPGNGHPETGPVAGPPTLARDGEPGPGRSRPGAASAGRWWVHRAHSRNRPPERTRRRARRRPGRIHGRPLPRSRSSPVPPGSARAPLAVYWARTVVGGFPDGQLYANLRGFDRDRSAPEPAEVLRGFLDALGIPPRCMPTGLDGRVGLLPQPASRQADAGRARQRPGRRTSPAVAARLGGLPGPRHQPLTTHPAGRDRRRSPH